MTLKQAQIKATNLRTNLSSKGGATVSVLEKEKKGRGGGRSKGKGRPDALSQWGGGESGGTGVTVCVSGCEDREKTMSEVAQRISSLGIDLLAPDVFIVVGPGWLEKRNMPPSATDLLPSSAVAGGGGGMKRTHAEEAATGGNGAAARDEGKNTAVSVAKYACERVALAVSPFPNNRRIIRAFERFLKYYKYSEPSLDPQGKMGGQARRQSVRSSRATGTG